MFGCMGDFFMGLLTGMSVVLLLVVIATNMGPQGEDEDDNS
jgi:hypothetical protein